MSATAAAVAPSGIIPARTHSGRATAILAVVAAIVLVWYAAAIWKNGQFIRDMDVRDGKTRSFAELVVASLTQEKPSVPAPHQVLIETINTTLFANPTKPSSLLFHAQVTLVVRPCGLCRRHAARNCPGYRHHQCPQP